MHKKSLILALVASYIFSSFSAYGVHHSSYSSSGISCQTSRIHMRLNMMAIVPGIIGAYCAKFVLESLWAQFKSTNSRYEKNQEQWQEYREQLKKELPSLYEFRQNLLNEDTKISNNYCELIALTTGFSSLIGILMVAASYTDFLR